MKAIAYSIQSYEKESLILANGKKHDLTLISNDLNDRTLVYAQGKETVIISTCDVVDQQMLVHLKQIGIKYIITRSKDTEHIDLTAATRKGFMIANAPSEDQSIDRISSSVIRNLDAWEQERCVGPACCCQQVCEMDLKKQ